jgi:hypothetical protein
MLGFVVAPLGQKVDGQFPYGIQYAYGGEGNYLCPYDPQWNQNGEAGFYTDTRLGGGLAGGVPTDAELGPVYGYTPDVGGWVNAAEGFFPAPWRVPGGWNSAGRYGPQMSLSGYGLGVASCNIDSDCPGGQTCNAVTGLCEPLPGLPRCSDVPAGDPSRKPPNQCLANDGTTVMAYQTDGSVKPVVMLSLMKLAIGAGIGVGATAILYFLLRRKK